MGSTKNFFAKKKEWSHFKDTILEHYLVPYTAKIGSTGKPLLFVDCFAGKGKFDDGNPGSPLIFASCIKNYLEKNPGKTLRALFIEKKYARELAENCTGMSCCVVREGSFEENIETILGYGPQYNVFLYVDPYGIKSLDLSHFEKIIQREFNTLELLVNFNTFGFLREGCRIMKYDKTMEEFSDESNDYESDENDDVDAMNRIAGGDYWGDIIRDFKGDKISANMAENDLATKYMDELGRRFRHVVNIPIKVTTDSIPKYRLFFGTNSHHGLFLMVDEMNKIWKRIIDKSRDGQGHLFNYDFPDMALLKGFSLEGDITEYIARHGGKASALEVTTGLIEKYGITFSVGDYTRKYKEMDGKSLIITRFPPLTPTGRKSTSMDWDANRIELELP
jgi:three-Cys-motif partner protein